jgi:hypothetical protein
MKNYITCLLLAACMIGCRCMPSKSESMNNNPMLAHVVFFNLNDNSTEQKEKLVRECHTYLKDHPGVVFFAAGTLAEDLQRPVNVRDFDVSLHVVFNARQAQDDYQKAPKHLEFIERNKANWKQVRVFDSIVR